MSLGTSLERSTSESNVWDSSGAWNPWHVLRVKVEEGSIPEDSSKKKKKRLGKGGLSVSQQTTIIRPVLLKWWGDGGWCPFDVDEMDFRHCNIPPHRISDNTSVRVILNTCDQKHQAFLFYAIGNPRKGVVTATIMGAITREEIKKNNEAVRISALHRIRELGAEEFRQQMREIYATNDNEKAHASKRIDLKRCIFPFPLKRRLLRISKKERITLDEVYARMVKFVSAVGWNDTVNDDQMWDGWRPQPRPKWFTCDTTWSRHEFASRHRDLKGMSEYVNIAGYLFGGVAAAVNFDYAEMRHRAERRRLEFFFVKWYSTEESVRFLIKENGMEELLNKEIDEKALEEYKRRNLVKHKELLKITGMADLKKPKNSASNQVSVLLQKIEESEREKEGSISTALPTSYGLLHFNECPPFILQDGASLNRGKVMIFYNEVKDVILYWMEKDQIYANGTVRSNLAFYQRSHLMAFAHDAEITAKDIEERIKTTVGGGMHRVNLSIKSNNAKECGSLDINIEELLEFSPPCIKGMLKTCERETRSLKFNERAVFGRYLAGLGIPMTAYDSIAYPLFVADCNKNDIRDSSEKAYKRTWDGKALWSGKYNNLSCMAIKRAMEESSTPKERCNCPYVDPAKIFNKNFTSLCRDQWKLKHEGDEDALNELYFPSQHVYASVKVKRRRSHMKIGYGESDDDNNSNNK